MLTEPPNYLTFSHQSALPFVGLSGVNPSFPIECDGRIIASKRMCTCIGNCRVANESSVHVLEWNAQLFIFYWEVTVITTTLRGKVCFVEQNKK